MSSPGKYNMTNNIYVIYGILTCQKEPAFRGGRRLYPGGIRAWSIVVVRLSTVQVDDLSAIEVGAGAR